LGFQVEIEEKASRKWKRALYESETDEARID
jgi:hypothetical protein